ncbi:MAG: hypothetical protein A2684_01505 [Candidatus Levybacteria bacterium RIFCSPHIGHO2_01_FULL_36_15b]|nr:MAG: hypothetical protein A2684_01505 [Candidatus Levybacteria bacterium RIFCSPHIGHO2_01_FULL_36_15b]
MQQNSTYEQNQNQRTVDLQKIIKRAVFSYWPVVILVLISSILAFLNYTPHTWLSGWDTLHPEFNFPLNIERLINGVFRIEQGLGAVAGHSNFSDLPRVLLLYIASFVIQPEFIRYFYIFLCLIAGPLGMYLFLEKYVLKDKIPSFLGALFYLLNLGTVQIFNVPFEMFTTLFAALPFVFYFATKYLTEDENKYKNLLFFAVSIIFTSPSAYAATLWYAFFACFVLYVLIYSRKTIKEALSIIGLTLLLNLFWIFPNIYFVINHAQDVQNANINLLFSESAFLKNKEFGDLGSLFFLKTFYFDWSIYNGSIFVSLLSPFIEHLKDIKVYLIGIIFGIFWISGLILSFLKNKKQTLPFLIPFLLSLFFLINSNFPTGVFFDFLQNHFPFFKEALRFPQNKFLNMHVFFVSIFFGYFMLFLSQKLKDREKNLILAVLISVALIFYSLPAFSGNLVNKLVRVNIPQSYFRLFDYLNNQPKNLRVSNFPIQSQWGWVYYKWSGQSEPSFQGAGFLYFGIPQPLLDRDFDRWSNFNESYYRELSYAVYKKDASLLGSVLKKYNVGFVFIDKNVFEPSHPEKALFFDESEKLLEQTGLISERKTFKNIKVYKVNQDFADLSIINTSKNVAPATKSSYKDFAYASFGNYITESQNSLYFPFRELVDNQSRLVSKNIIFEDDRIKFNINQATNTDISNFLKTATSTPANLILEKKSPSLFLSFYPDSPVFDNLAVSAPVKSTLSLNGQFLSINQSQLFDLNTFSENTPVLAGKVILKATANLISLYNSQNFEPVLDVSRVINPFFENCDEKAPPKAEFFGNKIKIDGIGSICVLIPYGFFPNDKNETLTNFGFEYKGNSSVKSCLFDQSTSSCIYYKDATIEKSNGANLVSFLYVLKPESANHTAIKLFFDKKEDLDNKFEISNFFASFSKATQSLELQNTGQNSRKVSFENIYLPKDPLSSSEVLFQNNFENDCNLPAQPGNQNDEAKKEVLSQDGTRVVKYSAKLGSFCDHYSYPNLPHNIGYFVVVKSKNEAGLPLTLCVTNYTSRRCDIYTSLSKNKDFGQDLFVIPPTDDDAIGYDINFENTSVYKTPAINFVSAVEFIPFPYDAIQNISIEASKLENYKILVSNTSFEKGFIAYEINNNSLLSKLLPALFGKQLKEHVLVNNWTNGWKLEAKSSDESSSYSYIIVFLPQYLEWMGLTLIFILIAFLLFKIRNRKSI